MASGFDLTLKGLPTDVSRKQVVEILKQYMAAAQAARAERFPQLADAAGADRQAWLDALPHYHPF